jgi:AcrR family transcriptional regulator
VSKVQSFIESTRGEVAIRSSVMARLDRIRAATIEECAEKSFRLASMASIAKRAHVSTASLYRDFGSREALLEQVAIFAAPMIAEEFHADRHESDPKARLLALLVHQGRVYKDPHANWLYRAHVSAEVLAGQGLLPIAEETHAQVEAFWANQLVKLQEAGLLAHIDQRETVNGLLGAVQRRTLLAMLLFGPNDKGKPDLEAAAQDAVAWLFETNDHDLPRGALGADLVSRSPRQLAQKSVVQMQVEIDLARSHCRNDRDTRQLKIFAAATQECSQMGFQRASMAGIARRAGVSTATLYTHFSDKNDLFLKAVNYLIPIIAKPILDDPAIKHPTARVANLLINHGSSYLDPFMGWLYRLYVSFEGQADSVVGRIGQGFRAVIEQFWHEHLLQLEAEGYLQPSDHILTVNFLLGAVERRSLSGFLLVGHKPDAYPSLVSAAYHVSELLFKRFGTQKFFSTFAVCAQH